MNSRVVILESFARPLYWLIVIVSLWVFFRGHNEPGGGFIAGLVATSATVLWAVTFGLQQGRAKLPLGSGITLAAVGVLLSAISGVPAFFANEAFLTHYWGVIPLGFTDYKISTVLLFDLGVYLCVWGGIAEYALRLLELDDES